MSAIDYLAMIGGPLAFLLLAVLGIAWILGPAPPTNPVKLIRDGLVKTGMSIGEVEAAAGRPKGIDARSDGGFTWRYSHGTSEPYVEDDAYVDFSASGHVTNVTVERTSMPGPEQLK